MPSIEIDAERTERQYWRDVWSYRELFFFLARRDILVRYKQTAIGIAWAIIRPLATTIVFTVIFGKLAKMPSEGVPYPVLVFAAMLPWQFFSIALAECGNSLIANANMVAKVYFPRLVMPFSSVMVGLVDLILSGVILVGLMVLYGVPFSWRLLTLPLFIILAFAASLGAGLWLAALSVYYRDFRYIIPFLVQFGLYVSPVGFSSSVVPEDWRFWYYLNPMAGVIDGFRWAITGGPSNLYWPGFACSLVVVAATLIGGLWYFRRMERTFADVI